MRGLRLRGCFAKALRQILFDLRAIAAAPYQVVMADHGEPVLDIEVERVEGLAEEAGLLALVGVEVGLQLAFRDAAIRCGAHLFIG